VQSACITKNIALRLVVLLICGEILCKQNKKQTGLSVTVQYYLCLLY